MLKRKLSLQRVPASPGAGTTTPTTRAKSRRGTSRPRAVSSEAAVLLEGWLLSSAQRACSSAGRKRYFAIAGHYLKYADDDDAVELRRRRRQSTCRRSRHVCSKTAEVSAAAVRRRHVANCKRTLPRRRRNGGPCSSLPELRSERAAAEGEHARGARALRGMLVFERQGSHSHSHRGSSAPPSSPSASSSSPSSSPWSNEASIRSSGGGSSGDGAGVAAPKAQPILAHVGERQPRPVHGGICQLRLRGHRSC